MRGSALPAEIGRRDPNRRLRCRECFDGDVAPKARIARSIDIAHRARPQGGHDLIRTDESSGGQAHAMRRLISKALIVGSTPRTGVHELRELVGRRRATAGAARGVRSLVWTIVICPRAWIQSTAKTEVRWSMAPCGRTPILRRMISSAVGCDLM